MGLTLSDVNSGKILIEATKIATRYNIKVPGDWMLVFKAIVTIEGMGRTLDPEFDLMATGKDLVKDLVKEQYSTDRLTKDFLWIAKDVAALLQVLPRQVRWMFRKFASNDFVFEFKSQDLQEIREQMDQNGRRLSLSVLGAGIFIASSIALQSDRSPILIWNYPLFAVIYFGLGCLILIKLILRSFK
jgi:ubiquinone biosynthesis protein